MTPLQFELQLRRHKEALGKLITRTLPVKAGTIVLHNVCGLDSDVMVTKNVAAK